MWINSHLKEGESVEANPISMARLKSRSEGIRADEVPGHQVAVGYLIKYHLRSTKLLWPLLSYNSAFVFLCNIFAIPIRQELGLTQCISMQLKKYSMNHTTHPTSRSVPTSLNALVAIAVALQACSKPIQFVKKTISFTCAYWEVVIAS